MNGRATKLPPPRPGRPARQLLAGLLLAAGLAAVSPAEADDMGGSVTTPLYQQECGACHLAYPPGMLPPASWQHLMAGLSRHYGVDASLDAGPAATLSAWLNAHAGTNRRVAEAPPEDRITRSAWFVRKHQEVAASTFRRAAIGSASNCAACHRTAEKGDFDEDNVRIPK